MINSSFSSSLTMIWLILKIMCCVVIQRDAVGPSQNRAPPPIPWPTSMPEFCLQKNFRQRIHLIREVRKCRKENKQDEIII